MNKLYVSRQPELRAAPGITGELPRILAQKGHRSVAVVTGGRSVRGKEVWSRLTDGFLEREIAFLDFTARGEPTPEMVDRFRDEVLRDLPDCDSVVAIGGGSVMDAAKALAAALGMHEGGSSGAGGSLPGIGAYLEGVGTLVPDGRTLPLIAVPTTAGTGSEATKNAVLRSLGSPGFKKSLRHDNFVPVMALIDPELYLGTPVDVTRASGLDAVTQLMEVFLSTKANAITDALARKGLALAGRAFPRLLGGEDTEDLRMDMALAAYLSGVGLASVGLGVVHGIASPMGARRDIPHGVVCGLLVAPSVRVTVAAAADSVRAAYADAAALLGTAKATDTPEAAVESLINALEGWAAPLPRLSSYGFTAVDIAEIAEGSDVKNHPMGLTTGMMADLMREVL